MSKEQSQSITHNNLLDSFDFGMVHVYQEKNIRIDNPDVEKEFIAGKDSRKQ